MDLRKAIAYLMYVLADESGDGSVSATARAIFVESRCFVFHEFNVSPSPRCSRHLPGSILEGRVYLRSGRSPMAPKAGTDASPRADSNHCRRSIDALMILRAVLDQ